MDSGNRLLVCGVGIHDDEVIRAVVSSDLVIAREDIASNWLKPLEIEKLIRFSLKEQQSVDEWVNTLLSPSTDGLKISYVTPLKPIFTDLVALALARTVGPDHTKVVGGRDYTEELVQNLVTYSPSKVTILDGLELLNKHHPPFTADNLILIYAPQKGKNYTSLQTLLSMIYPENHLLHVYYADSCGNPKWHQHSLKELNEIRVSISIMMIPPASSDSSLESFQEVIAHLRSPEDGCPWDKKQTHSSLRTYLLEETYEALDALDKNDTTSLKEELGDILLQILLHAQIAEEAGEFNMADVIGNINHKIIYRHPHVFKDWVVEGVREVTQNWESLKVQERITNGEGERKGMLDGVPLSFPALAQAQAIQDRAARVGFDWPEIGPVLDKVIEELEEVKNATTDEERSKELGDLLFALVNVIRWYKVDAESALRTTNLKFRKRFAYIEEQARLSGNELQKMTLAEMDVFWEQAKKFDV